ncbi:MAG: hypothetical protein AAFQ87_25005 [Bacteroidota bacterium]
MEDSILKEVKGNYALQFDADSQFILQIKAPNKPGLKVLMLGLLIVMLLLSIACFYRAQSQWYAALWIPILLFFALRYWRGFWVARRPRAFVCG